MPPILCPMRYLKPGQVRTPDTDFMRKMSDTDMEMKRNTDNV
jgi:hypothetical protein